MPGSPVTTRRRLQLVLDAGGVLVDNLTPSYWQWISRMANETYETVRVAYKNEVRNALWNGTMDEESFWSWLGQTWPNLDVNHARSVLPHHMIPLPALERIGEWSKYADLHLLSNHRIEWVAPLLQEVRASFTSMTVSSEVGCSKPDPSIYAHVENHLKEGFPVWFVDDQEKNLAPARERGWNTLLADPEGIWIQQVTSLVMEGGKGEPL